MHHSWSTSQWTDQDIARGLQHNEAIPVSEDAVFAALFVCWTGQALSQGNEEAQHIVGPTGDLEFTAHVRGSLSICMMGQYKGFPATSCKEIYDCNPNTPSGHYWIYTDSQPLKLYCEMNATQCGNITGGWTRIAHIDMKDQQNCPSPLRTLTSFK